MHSEWRVKGDEEDRDGRTVKTDLVGMGEEWRMTARDGGSGDKNKNQLSVSMQPSPRTSGVKSKAA